MHKTRLILLSATGLMGYFIVTGWASGPAHNGSLFNGTPGVATVGTCKNCHAATNVGITTINSASFKDDATGIVVTDAKYKPGHIYTVEINASGTGSQGFFGFQANFRKNGNTNAGTLSATMANTGIATAEGYSIVEHTAKVTAPVHGVFTPSFKWTAPASGTGAVTMHAIVNAVDGNSAISGDAVSNPFTITLNEATTTSVPSVAPAAAISVFPNPIAETLHIRIQATGNSMLTIYNAVGRTMLQQAVTATGAKELDLSVTQLPAGLYYLQQINGSGRSMVSFIKQ